MTDRAERKQAANEAGEQSRCEQEYLRRARDGDRAAFDALRATLEPPMRRFLHRLAGRLPGEEDILQDAFVALYVNLRRIDPPENLRPFLYRIIRNRCYDELRRQGRYQAVSLDARPGEAAPVLRDHRPQPSEAVDRLLLYGELRQAMDRLPEAQREALILYADEGLSYAEIAVALATDVNNVKARIHHARRSLANRLSPETKRALGVPEN